MISNELAGEYEKELIKVSVYRLELEVEALESQIRQNERIIKFLKEELSPLKKRLKQQINNLTNKN